MCVCVCVRVLSLLLLLYFMYILCQERALDYLSTCIDQVHTFNDILQLVIVELVYKVLCMCDVYNHLIM